jgi:hypothetical protein
MIPTVPIARHTLRDLAEAVKRVSPRGQEDADHLAALVAHCELLLHIKPAA